MPKKSDQVLLQDRGEPGLRSQGLEADPYTLQVGPPREQQ